MANDLTFDAIIEIEDKSFVPRFTSGESPGSLSNSYEDLKMLPKINGITIIQDHNGAYYGLQDKMRPLTAEEVQNIIDGGEIQPSPDERYVNEYMLAYYNQFVASKGDLENKVDKIPGMGLSETSFTQAEKTKLANMSSMGEENKINAISVNGVIRPPSAAPAKVVALTVPTRTSQLTNDANYQTFNNMVSYTNTKYDILIPSQASAVNQLADKDFVNSTFVSLNANRVTYNAEGNGFPTRNALLTAVIFYHGGVQYTPTQHDYALIGADEGAPSPYTNGQTRMEFDGTQWNYAYGINDRPFTAAETAAIESGITSGLVRNISEPDETPRQDSMKYVTSGGLWREFGGNVQELETENKTIIGAINEVLNDTSPLSNDPNLNDPNTGLSTVGSKEIMDKLADKVPLRYSVIGSNAPNTGPWWEYGTLTLTTNADITLTLLVEGIYTLNSKETGILRIGVRPNGINQVPIIEWLLNTSYSFDDFILAYTADKTTFKLYMRETAQYQFSRVSVLTESQSPVGAAQNWILNRAAIPMASLPDGYTTVTSTVAPLQPATGGGDGRNILDNPQGSINQSGLTEWTEAGYTVDRWKLGDGLSLSLSNDVLRFTRLTATTNPTLNQPIENIANYAGRTVTLSVRYKTTASDFRLLINDGTSVTQATLPTTDTYRIMSVTKILAESIPLHEIGIRSGNLGASGDYIEFDTTRPFIKLELGSVSTLANDGPVDYVTELAKSQKYQYAVNQFKESYCIAGIGIAISATRARIVISIPTSMYKRPIPVIKEAWMLTYSSNTFTVTAINIASITASQIIINADVDSGLIIGEFYQLMANNNSSADLFFDANL